jgi:hypothetical protein
MKTSTIDFLTYETLETLARSEHWTNFNKVNGQLIYTGEIDQFVDLADEQEIALINVSLGMTGLFAREVAQVKIHCGAGEQICSQIIRGKKNQVSTYSELRNLVLELTSKARTSGRVIKHVEIVHTHIKKQKLVFGVGQIKAVHTQALSLTDIALARRIRQFLDCPLLLKAVTRDKITYFQWF